MGAEFDVDLQATLDSKEILIKYEDEVSASSFVNQANASNVFEAAADLGNGLYEVKLPANADPQLVVADLNNTPGIVYAELNYVVQIASNQFDHPNPHVDSLWGLENEGQTGGSRY